MTFRGTSASVRPLAGGEAAVGAMLLRRFFQE